MVQSDLHEFEVVASYLRGDAKQVIGSKYKHMPDSVPGTFTHIISCN